MSSTPTLPWVLPMYEYMRRHLQSYSTDLHNPLRTTADAGLIKLNKYYFKARECQFNVIATSESHLSLIYFRRDHDMLIPIL